MSQGPVTNPSLLIRLREPDDNAAWDTFLKLYEPLILRFCQKRGLQETDARDVTQDVLQSVISAIKNLEYDRSRGLFRSWLFRVIRSKLVDHFRRQGKQVQGTGKTAMHQVLAQQPAQELESEWDRDMEVHLFEWACQQVKPEITSATWQAFWQNAVENRPPSEVAQATGLSVGGVYTAKSRVVARIRAKIREASDFD